MSRWMIGVASALALSVGVLAGCGDASGPSAGRRQLGILQLEGYKTAVSLSESALLSESPVNRGVRWDREPSDDDLVPEVLVAPDTVAVGESFDVTVHTIGPNGCWRPDGQEARESAGMVELTPYDAHSGARACTEQLGYLPHTSTLTLDSAGDWVIRVSGRRARHGDSSWEVPVTAEKTIVVR